VKLVNTSRKADTRLSRAKLVLEKVADMRALAEQFGVLDYHGSALSSQKEEIEQKLQEITTSEIEHLKDEAIKKSEMGTTLRGKTGPYAKYAEKIEKLEEYISDKSILIMEREWAKNQIRKLEVEELKKGAEKAAFKGDKKKAIDKYKDALFHIKTDEIPDEQQANEIEKIESRIRELEA